jgi:hypothetical protein
VEKKGYNLYLEEGRPQGHAHQNCRGELCVLVVKIKSEFLIAELFIHSLSESRVGSVISN